MKTENLTQNIMRQVVSLELIRIKRWIIIMLVTFSILFVCSLLVLFVIRQILEAQQTLSVLELLGEDGEIIRDYGLDTLITFLDELPKLELFIFLFTISIAISTMIELVLKYPGLEKKQQKIYAYALKKVSMGEQHKNLLKPILLITCVIVLLVALVLPRLLNRKKSAEQSGNLQKNQETVNTSSTNPQSTSTAGVLTASPGSTISDSESEKNRSIPASINLTIITPSNNSSVNSATVQIKGKTTANADVFVNEIDARADSNGNFSVSYTMEEGDNYLVIGVNDEYGNFTETELNIFLDQ